MRNYVHHLQRIINVVATKEEGKDKRKWSNVLVRPTNFRETYNKYDRAIKLLERQNKIV